jgi:amphi-Trp domain-containing protein
MGKETRLFKSEEKQSRAQASAFLQELAGKIADGQVVLLRGQEEITLQIPGQVVLEIQVEDEQKGRRGIQHSLEIEIKWFDDDEAGGPLVLG